MIGQTIESRPRLPLGVYFWLLLALLLDVPAIALGNVHLAVGSLLPWLVALTLWRIRDRPFAAHFTETALEVKEPSQVVPYADLQGLRAPRRPDNPFKAGPRSYLIQVIHSGGIVRIPARLNVPSDEVFSFLYRQFTPSGSRAVPNALVDFLRQRERQFGPHEVWTYRARPYLGRSKRHPGLRAFFRAWALAGVAWIVWGILWGFVLGEGVARRDEGASWVGAGTMSLFFGGLCSLLFWMEGRQNNSSIRNWQKSGLIVAPDGLALVQGDLVGELRWDEVRDVKLGKSRSSFQFTAVNHPQRGIVLKVEGAVIVIADIYDRPLALIYQNIRHYWRGQTQDDDWDRDTTPRRTSEGITPTETHGP